MATLKAERARAGWAFWAWWVAANVLGWTAGLMLCIVLGWGIAEGITGAVGEVAAAGVGWLAGGLVGGGLIGILQAAALKELGVPFGRWTLATSLGLGLGLGAAFPLLVALETYGPDPRAVALMACAGLVLAAAQWSVLRRAVTRAWLWLPAGALAMTALFLVAAILGGEGREVLASAASGTLYAGVTGAALAPMLRGRAGVAA